jgi:hypothetical protein
MVYSKEGSAASMKRIFLLLLLVALLLCGCSVQTVDEMYAIPKRSEDYNDLQSAIDGAMVGLSYCAPLTGENQQPVQMADLNGDGFFDLADLIILTSAENYGQTKTEVNY